MVRDILDSNDIRLLVDTMYDHILSDDLLGPVFSGIENVESHKEALCNYWRDVLLDEKYTAKDPLTKHEDLQLNAQHFTRRLTLFFETLDGLFAGPNCEKAKVIVIKKSEEFQNRLEIPRF